MLSVQPAQQTTPLVSTAWLADHLNDPKVRVIEVYTDHAAYREGHLPGAIGCQWKETFWHETDREFPTPEEMAQRLGRLGIARDDTIIVDSATVQFSTYGFWVLTMCGHPDVRVLEGGRKKWVAEGRALTKDVPTLAPVSSTPDSGGNYTVRIGRDEIRAKLKRPGFALLDARSTEEYAGERNSPRPQVAPGQPVPANSDNGAERTGHIPGARHLFFMEFLNPDNTFKQPEEMRALLDQAGIRPEQSEEVVAYCRLSHRASLAWFAMTYVLGYQNVRVYDGSWTEWGSIVGFPVEK